MARRGRAVSLIPTILVLGWCVPAWAQTVTRGPYLNQGGPDRVTVRWRTDSSHVGRVRYGTSPSSLTSVKDEASSTTEHVVTITGLAANTKYYYSVGTTSATIAGDSSYFFLTSPAAGAAKPTRVWVLGDSGTADTNQKAVRDAYYTFTGTRHTDLWLMLGDNAYSDGTDTQYQSAVFNIYPAMLRKSVLWPTLGNHDGHSADSATQSGPYYNIFTLPKNGECGGPASGTEAYYSFDYGNIHFICLDSYETSRAVGGTMYNWAKNSATSTTRDWIIAFWHHPPYSKGSHNSDTESALTDMRKNFLPMLEDAGVDLVLCGHSHSYERSFLLDGHYGTSGTLTSAMKIDGGSGRDPNPYDKPAGTASHAGAVYVVAGSSGKTSGGTLNHPAMYISLNQLGSLVLDIDGSRLDAKFIRSDGTTGDFFTIVKGAGTTNNPPSVSITSPSNGATFTAPATITINASASDPDGTISKVEFFQGSTLLGTDTTSPYSFTWSGVAAGSYSLTAKATDNGGAARTSSPVSVTVSAAGTVTQSFQDGVSPSSTYAGTRDTYISENSPATNYATATSLSVDGDTPSGTGKDTSTLLKWDLSAIPPGSSVSAASITVNVTNATSQTYELYELKRNWVETQATWQIYATGASWEIAGAKGSLDRGATVLGTLAATATGAYTLNLNSSGLALVQRWVDKPSTNYGLIAVDSAATNGLNFSSREHATATLRPKLTVTYALPSVSISASDASASEPGTDKGAFTVSRTGSTGASLTVNYSIGGTAANGTDYSTLAASVTIPAGAASQAIGVSPLDDALAEGSETVVLTLASSTKYALGSPASATVTIADNDGTTATVTKSFQDGVSPSSTYAGTRDTKIYSGAATTNYGGSTLLEADGSPDFGVLLKWDVGAIPAGSKVQSVSITVNVTNVSSHTYEVYELKRNWVESQATWNVYASGLAWQAAGAQGSNDRGTSVLGSMTASSTGLKTFNLNSSGVALVQRWVDTPSSNFGFVIQDYVNASDGLDFSSSEASTASQRPKLSITYATSSTARTLEEEPAAAVPADYITLNGQSYGTIQEALDAAQPGETVILGAMTFEVPQGLSVKGGVSIQGQGPLLTVLNGAGAPAVVALAGGTGDGRTLLEQFTATGGGTGIDTGQADVLLRNLQVVRNSGDGILTGQLGLVEAVSLTVSDNGGNGFRILTPTASVRGAVASGNTLYGFDGPPGAWVDYSAIAGNLLGPAAGGVALGEAVTPAPVPFLDPVELDYREAAGSPSIDAGHPADPYDQEPEPNGERVNQGAFGNTAFAATASEVPPGAPPAPAGGDDRSSGGKACGALGLEALLLFLWARLRVRRH